MAELVLVTPPVGEPVSTADLALQLGMGQITDLDLERDLSLRLSGYIRAARGYCESYTRSVYLTQKWLVKYDGFPCFDVRYAGWDQREIRLPKLPFQAIEFLKYVDTSGVLLEMTQDASYGTSPDGNQYRYQLAVGGETQPTRILPAWATPWPPTRRVASSVLVQFKCGFGGPVKGSVAEASNLLIGPKFIPGDVGRAVCVPGAAEDSSALETSIASIDGTGQATLATAASKASTTDALIWVGRHIPEDILLAIKLAAQFIFEQGGAVDLPMPRIVNNLLDPYRNLVA